MVRVLIISLLANSLALAQHLNSDSVSVFKIRPAERRIEGLFCNQYALNEGTKTMYYLTYDGDAYQFETKLTQEDFYTKLIREQKDLSYEKGTYSLSRKSEKATIKIIVKGDTSFLLGKYRSGDFYLIRSDTMITSKRWNVGSFIIDISNKNPEEKLKPVMKTMGKSIYSTSCPNEIFWSGELISVQLDPTDTVEYQRLKNIIKTVPLKSIHKFEGNYFEYYKEQYYVYLLSDSQAIYNKFTNGCKGILTQMDSISEIQTSLKWEKRFGVKNYFIKDSKQSIWIIKQSCEVIIKFYDSKTIEKLINLENKRFFEKLKKVNPLTTSAMKKSCGFNQ